MSSTPDLPATTSLYQLRVVLHGISPLIWRRLVIPAGTTIAELHAVLQTAFGWSGEHLPVRHPRPRVRHLLCRRAGSPRRRSPGPPW
jgi:hypothetical protein